MWQKIKRFSILLLSAAVLAGCSEGNIEKVPTEVSENLEVHFLDVGQGDCTLIRSGEHAMLIDGGNNNKGVEVQEYLESKGIEKLDYIIGTHPDADHIGGLDVVLNQFENDELLIPDVSKDTRTYEEVIEAADEEDSTIHHPEVGEQYTLGEASFTVVAPNGKDYGSVNENSIGILLEHGEKKFLFVGDAEEESEEEMLKNNMDLQADVYKVSHHGSRTGTTEAFLEAVRPEYAVISAGEGNSYGHPHAEVLNRLRGEGIETFRTDEQGTIVAVSDGENIKWNMSPTDDWTAGEPKGSAALQERKLPADKKKKTEFIVNVNTKKFHLPDCASVSDMKKSNKKEMKATRQEMIEKGYAPCQNCLK